jgi:uncharacterized protein
METLVQFPNRRKKLLRGMLHRPSAGSRQAPGVVFFHGFTGDRMESHWLFVKCARALERAGIASLRFDFFGSGESEGSFREATLQSEISDARAAVDFFRRQRGVDPKRVGLCGLSLGGAIAAVVARPAHARALVLWSAVAHPRHLRRIAKARTRLLPNGAREYKAHEISARFLGRLENVRPLESIRHFHAPTLIIHPGKDEHLPLNHPEAFIRSAGAAIKRKVIIPGADHTYTSLAWEREVIARTVEWFAQFLRA